MQCPILREETDSEELSIEEEIEMCKSWKNDEDKLTFIILSKELYDKNKDEVGAMIGDINGFVHSDSIELSVMIAEKDYRKQGCAKEALKLMIKYCQIVLNFNNFFAIINDNNIKSIKLFNQLNFTITEKIEVFKQIKLSNNHIKIEDKLELNYYETNNKT
ncbi:N-acetyltransferase 9 [Strongyloides ratti]|uniref:N-acetyltransferase 9 n=1 Tax=Strongyloides ratti TaxID=34506 RepID=A0A090MXI2_STRRB|nr:N-acetyltransferase 9 [Strongyloides ratti]CEF65479.1 N-acetyltransferase 9 [Strongyloides ratti]